MNPIVTLLHAIEYLETAGGPRAQDRREALDYLGLAYADLLRDHERERPRNGGPSIGRRSRRCNSR
jgi:hypothetical protein